MRDLMEKLEIVQNHKKNGPGGVPPIVRIAAILAKRIDDLFDSEFSDDFDDGVMANAGVAIDDPKFEKFADSAYRELWREVARRLDGPLGDGLKPILRAR